MIPGAALALGLLVFLLVDSSLLLSDPDSIWHVAVGRWIWTHRQVPHVDVFSHTFAGAPWIAKEWLSQLLYFAAYAAAGWWGVVALAAAAIAAAFVVLHAWLRQRLRPEVALALTLAAIFLGSFHFLARPHALVLPVIAAWMATIVGASDRGRAPPLGAALLMVLWANMHGSFPLGLVMAAVLAGEAVLRGPPSTRVTALRGWVPFLAAAGAATLISPYGWRAILVPLTVGHVESIPLIDEWKPLAFDLPGVAALCSLAVAAVLLARDPRREALRAVAVGLLGIMMIGHVRFISLFGLLAPFLVARVLGTCWGCGARPAGAPRGALGIALVPPALFVAALLATMRPAPIARIAPEAAVDFAFAHGVAGPVYNSYDFGGFLIGKGVKTFVDGRTDQLFLGGFLLRLHAALAADGDDAFAALLAHHHVTWALVGPRSRAAAHLAGMAGWTRLYQDEIATVFAKTGPADAKQARAFSSP